MRKKIAVLMTCFNRRKKTLACLRRLFDQKKAPAQLTVYLVDAGSPDGTAAAVRRKFPQVRVIDADASMFWNRGMHLAWKHAAAGDDDFFLWLNDDTMLWPEALRTLLENSEQTRHQAILCGAACDKTLPGRPVTYSGHNFGAAGLIVPNGHLQSCNLINGNVVLIPRQVYERVGNLDPIFPHGIGDFDYACRAREAGVDIFVATAVVGHCIRSPGIQKFRSKAVPFRQRLQALYSPKGVPPYPFFVYLRRHFGWLHACKHILSLHFKVVFPDL